jgi:hypothetical protein
MRRGCSLVCLTFCDCGAGQCGPANKVRLADGGCLHCHDVIHHASTPTAITNSKMTAMMSDNALRIIRPSPVLRSWRQALRVQR